MKNNLFGLVLFQILSFGSLSAQKPFSVIKTFHIQSGGNWDYIAVGPDNGRLYVSHSTQVNILDIKTGDSIAIIPNTTGVHGIAFDREQNKGFTSNGRLNTVTVFDLLSNAIITQIPAGQNPDAIIFDPFTKMIITCNGKGKNISIIDPIENKLVDSIDVGGKPEEAVSDGKGLLYINLEDKSEIVMVNMKTRKIDAHWSLLPAEEPTGLALDKITHRLFAGCGNKLLAVVDASSGKLVKTIPIGDRCDGVAFDESTKNVFTSNGEGTISVIHETGPNQYDNTITVTTKPGARTISVDQRTHLLYLPTADFESVDPSQKVRQRMIPGSFQVLVVGQ